MNLYSLFKSTVNKPTLMRSLAHQLLVFKNTSEFTTLGLLAGTPSSTQRPKTRVKHISYSAVKACAGKLN